MTLMRGQGSSLICLREKPQVKMLYYNFFKVFMHEIIYSMFIIYAHA
jgi:hypothetical protein